MATKSVTPSSGGAFYANVDKAFYDEAKRENHGTLPANLVDADGKPRKLTMAPADRAYRQKWTAMASKMRNSKAVPNKPVKSACIPCAMKAAAKIPPVVLPSKKLGKPVQVGSVKPQHTVTAATLPPSLSAAPVQKEKPCNLQTLKLAEPAATIREKPGTRMAEIRMNQQRKRRVCPTLLASGDTFQITAPSKYNPPRQIKVAVVTESVCDGAKHPELRAADSKSGSSKVTQQATLAFTRPPMPGDDGLPGFWPVLNSIFEHSSQSYPLVVESCGHPAGGSAPAVSSLEANIEVFPADQYELELKLPALLKPDSLSFKPAKVGWENEKERKEEEVKAAGKEAEEAYRSSKELRDVGSEAEWRNFAEDLTKKRLGVKDETYVDQIEVKLTQTDGTRVLEAPTQDIINLVRMILEAEYRFKQIEEWIDNFQVGPGVRVKFDVQFLAGRLKANWGYAEYIDHRVFLGYSGSVKLDLIKASVDVSAGWKTAGLADLLVVLKGDGTISLNVPAIKKEDPDEPPKASINPEGELKLSGSLEGTVMWFVKAAAGLETTFKADTEDFKIFAEDGIFGGKLIISREAVYATFSCTQRIWGGTVTEKVIKEDPHVAEFHLS